MFKKTFFILFVSFICSCNQNQESISSEEAAELEQTASPLTQGSSPITTDLPAGGVINQTPINNTPQWYAKSADSNETDSNETDSNETDSNETDSNEADSNEADSNEADSNEADSNEADSNEADSNEDNSCSIDTDKDGAMDCADEWPYNSNCYVNCTSSSSSTAVSTTSVDPNAPYYKYYQDDDGDGFGNSSSFLESTQKPTGYVLDSSDCDDGDQDIGSKTTDADCDGALSESDDPKEIDCNDASILFGAKKNDTDCDGVLAASDCDDTDALLKLDENNDNICDELQFFYDTDYQVQVLIDGVWQYLTTEEGTYGGYSEYFLRRADSSNFKFQFRLATDQTFKTTVISSGEVEKNSMKGNYIYSVNRARYMSSTYSATYIITMGNPSKTKGTGFESGVGYVEVTMEDNSNGNYLVSHTEDYSDDVKCPEGKLCSQEFKLKYPNDSNRWFAKHSLNSSNFGRDLYSQNAAKLRLIKDAPTE